MSWRQPSGKTALVLSVLIGGSGGVSCNAEVPQGASTCSEAKPCAPTSALIAMSDQASSGVGAIALGQGNVSAAGPSFFGVDLGRDPQLAVSNGRAFFIARDSDTLFEISPRCGEPICRWSTRHRGALTNPQDVAVAPDGSLWVPRFGLPNVAVIDSANVEVATITLPDLDGDGNPNASALRIVWVAGRAKAFVAVGLLGYKDARRPFHSERPSALVVIDVATRTVERTIPLRARNPFNTIVEHGGVFFLSGPGNFDVADETDAGIERLDPNDPDRERMLVPEAELGGSPSAVAIDGACGAAIVADATLVNATSVVTFDAKTGETSRVPKKGGALLGPSEGYDFWAITWSEGKLLVGDRRRTDRGYPIWIFTRRGGETAPCDLVQGAEPVFVAQKPVALRPVP